MNESKFVQSSKTLIFMFSFPLFVIFSCILMHEWFPGFWEETVFTFVITVISFLVVKIPSLERDKSEIIFRDSLIITTGAILLAVFAYYQNSDKNNFGIILKIIFISVPLGFILFNFDEFLGLIEHSWKRYYKLNGLLLVFFTAGMLSQAWIHFGTQFIWIPVISTLIFSFSLLREEEEILTTYLIISSAIAIISIVYEFWSSEIIFGWVLWQVLLGLVGLVLLVLILVFIRKRIKNKKAEELKHQQTIKESAEKEKTRLQKEKRDAEYLEEVNRIINDINEKGWKTWSQILFVARYFDNVNKLYENIAKIHDTPLEQTVFISKMKKQIVWGGDFRLALQIIEEIVKKSYSDEELTSFVQQLNSFLVMINGLDDFIGYKEIIEEIKRLCLTTFNLLPKEHINK